MGDATREVDRSVHKRAQLSVRPEVLIERLLTCPRSRRPEISHRTVHTARHPNTRTGQHLDRRDRGATRRAAPGGNAAHREPARHAVSTGRLDRASGGPPRAGQPSEHPHPVQVGAHRRPSDDQSLRREELGDAPGLPGGPDRALTGSARNAPRPLAGTAPTSRSRKTKRARTARG